MLFALATWLAARLIPPSGRAAPDLKLDFNIARSTYRMLAALKAEPRLWWGGLVASWFWLIGAVALSLLPPLVQTVIGGNDHVITAFLAVFAIAIAVGSGLASWLAHGRIVLFPTLLAAVLLAIFALDLGWTTWNLTPAATKIGLSEVFKSGAGIHIALDLAGLAIAGGLFIVPAFSAVQAWAGADRRARVVAAVNVLNAAFMTLGGVGVALVQTAGVTPPVLFLAIGVANIAVAFVIARTMPTSPLRDFLMVTLRALYRLEVHGLENVAKAGPHPIIALNHVSFLDAAIALSFLEQEPVFAIDHGIAQRWWVKPFLKLTRAMPLDPTKPMATRSLINAVRSGDTLIIFPEGRITVTGSLMKVYDGAGLIADKSGAMVVPVRLKGPEATPFSRLDRTQVRRRWFPKITVTVLEPVALTVDPEIKGKRRRMAAGAALYQIMSDLVFRTTSTDRTVMDAIIASAKQYGAGRTAVEDPLAGALSYRKLLLGVAVLGRKLMPVGDVGEAVGVLLPNANGAAVATLALMSAGRVPAMINFSAGLANVRAACRAANITTIVTSRAFIEKARLGALVEGLTHDVNFLFLEDVRASVSLMDKLRGLREAKRPLVKRQPDDPAAILFTSGSEGTPKGVVLSHRNMLANAAQAEARIDFGRRDKVFNVLPLFHSFGLTIGLILPLVSGVPVYLYPSPLHYRIVPEMIYGTNATILFGTDTFLAGYARSAHPYDFRSLRYVLAGAEPVKETTRRTYMEKFGLRILEGYGVTETAPALALNTPMFNKFGTVGRLLPGMEARLEGDPRHRCRRAAACARAKRDARLFAYGEPGRAGTSARGLARHRRYRHHRRRRFHRHQGPRQALRQNRRRNDLARRDRGISERPLARRPFGMRQRSGRTQGRAYCLGDDAARCNARGVSGLRQVARCARAHDARRRAGGRENAAARLGQDRQPGARAPGPGTRQSEYQRLAQPRRQAHATWNSGPGPGLKNMTQVQGGSGCLASTVGNFLPARRSWEPDTRYRHHWCKPRRRPQASKSRASIAIASATTR